MHSLLHNVITWAQNEDTVRAVAVTGSLGRDDGSVDEWSDLDVQIIARDPAAFLADQSWLRAIGNVWIAFAPNPADSFLLVWFSGGKKVDFNFLPVEYVTKQVASGTLTDEYQRGYVVALDKDGMFEGLPLSPHQHPAPIPPTHEEFQKVVDEFWFEAIHVAQYLRRHEMWVVRFRDWTMKTDLLQMMEWHAQAQSEWQRNTWTIGKRIEGWVDPDARSTLSRIWAGWDTAESWQTLFETVRLFSRLAEETASNLGLTYRKALYADITAYLHSLLDEEYESGS